MCFHNLESNINTGYNQEKYKLSISHLKSPKAVFAGMLYILW